METNNLNKKSPNEILITLGNLFETSRKENDLERLMKSIDIANNIKLEKFDILEKANFYFFLGNAWSYVQGIKYPEIKFEFESEEIEKRIVYYRKALGFLRENNDDFIKCQVLTNIGNLFNTIGRIVESQEYFNLCLDINPRFGMAIGNKGFGLFYYARVIFDPHLQFIFMQYSRKYLLDAILSKDVYPDAKNAYQNILQKIESTYPIEQLDDFKKYGNYYKKLPKKEIEYRQWCAKNRLFINPLNDILYDSVIANDYLFVPTMILDNDEKPIYQRIYNQLKQEFVSARYLFFESISRKTPHFSDKEVVLMDTLDYADYSFSLEKAKISFRICYSLFDKIAYLINIYFKLGHDPNNVGFRNIWYTNGKKNKGLKSKILNIKNWPMRGLFWLSKDLDEKGFESPIEPEAKELTLMRNYMEHKSFMITAFSNPDNIKNIETYKIERSLFYEKTLKVLKLSRSALLYLSFLIYNEEIERHKNKADELSISIDMVKIRDKDKL